ncbi:MAG: helix-turn-helix domain-containing protein [Beutenbergiaceae bacterium]
MQPRFLSLADVCEVLQVPLPTVRALVRSGELKAIQVGGKGTWRVEDTALEAYIAHRYQVEEQRRSQLSQHS